MHESEQGTSWASGLGVKAEQVPHEQALANKHGSGAIDRLPILPTA